MAEAREANINVVGNWRMPVLRDLNEKAIIVGGNRGGSEGNEIWYDSRAGWISSGMFNERYYGSVGMVS